MIGQQFPPVVLDVSALDGTPQTNVCGDGSLLQHIIQHLAHFQQTAAEIQHSHDLHQTMIETEPLFFICSQWTSQGTFTHVQHTLPGYGFKFDLQPGKGVSNGVSIMYQVINSKSNILLLSTYPFQSQVFSSTATIPCDPSQGVQVELQRVQVIFWSTANE